MLAVSKTSVSWWLYGILLSNTSAIYWGLCSNYTLITEIRGILTHQPVQRDHRPFWTHVMRPFQLPLLLLCCNQWTSHDCCMWSLALVHQCLSHVLSHDFSSCYFEAEQNTKSQGWVIWWFATMYVGVWLYDSKSCGATTWPRLLKFWCGFLLVNPQHLWWLLLSRNHVKIF